MWFRFPKILLITYVSRVFLYILFLETPFSINVINSQHGQFFLPKMLYVLQLLGDFVPHTSYQGFAPRPHWGPCVPQTSCTGLDPQLPKPYSPGNSWWMVMLNIFHQHTTLVNCLNVYSLARLSAVSDVTTLLLDSDTVVSVCWVLLMLHLLIEYSGWASSVEVTVALFQFVIIIIVFRSRCRGRQMVVRWSVRSLNSLTIFRFMTFRRLLWWWPSWLPKHFDIMSALIVAYVVWTKRHVVRRVLRCIQWCLMSFVIISLTAWFEMSMISRASAANYRRRSATKYWRRNPPSSSIGQQRIVLWLTPGKLGSVAVSVKKMLKWPNWHVQPLQGVTITNGKRRWNKKGSLN